jgi:septal ring factor EnvC (AmiA/AmiB activator)
MSRFITRTASALLLLLAFVALGAGAQQTASPKDLKRLQAAIVSLQKELKQARGKHSALEEQLKRDEVAIGKLSLAIEDNGNRQKTLARELEQLRARQSQLEQQRKAQQVLIAAQLRSAYQLGQEKTLKVLLNQEDPALISRAMTYVDYLNRARLQQIERFNATIAELAALEPSIVAKSLELKDAGDKLARDKDQLAGQQRSREQTLASLAGTISSKKAKLQQYEKDRARLEALLNTVEDVTRTFATIDDAQPFAKRKGKMKWPASGELINRFGSQRQDGGLKWQGVEIRSKAGTQVRAIHHGRVVFADWFGGQGLLIIIDHGDGYMSLYGHNQSLLRQTGDWIGTGEPISTVGASGGRSEPGLYFEIRHRGKANNPTSWCRS